MKHDEGLETFTRESVVVIGAEQVVEEAGYRVTDGRECVHQPDYQSEIVNTI